MKVKGKKKMRPVRNNEIASGVKEAHQCDEEMNYRNTFSVCKVGEIQS